MDEVEERGDLLKVDVAIRRAIHVEGELQTRPFEASLHEPLRIAGVCLFCLSLGAPARVAQEHLQQHDGAEVGRAVRYRFWPKKNGDAPHGRVRGRRPFVVRPGVRRARPLTKPQDRGV